MPFTEKKINKTKKKIQLEFVANKPTFQKGTISLVTSKKMYLKQYIADVELFEFIAQHVFFSNMLIKKLF